MHRLKIFRCPESIPQTWAPGCVRSPLKTGVDSNCQRAERCPHVQVRSFRHATFSKGGSCGPAELVGRWIEARCEYFVWLPVPTCWWRCTPGFVGPQCGLGASWSYRNKVGERWEIAVRSGSSKLYAIPPDLVAQRVKLDLANHYCVPLCRFYKPETSICLWLRTGLFSWQKAQGHKRSQGWGALRQIISVETWRQIQFLGTHTFQRLSSWSQLLWETHRPNSEGFTRRLGTVYVSFWRGRFHLCPWAWSEGRLLCWRTQVLWRVKSRFGMEYEDERFSARVKTGWSSFTPG